MFKKSDVKILLVNGTKGEKVDGLDLILASQLFNLKVSDSKPSKDLIHFHPNIVIIHEAGNMDLFRKLLSLLSTKKYSGLFIIKVRDTHDLTRPKVKHKQLQYFMQPVDPDEIVQFINQRYEFAQQR